MTPLDPAYVKVLRVRGVLSWLLLLALAIVGVVASGPGLAALPGALTALILSGAVLTLVLPQRRYRAWAFDFGEDELHVSRGVMTQVHTIVPFRRVQHLDVAQGPIERRYGLAQLVLHTAGTHGAIVTLPGLDLAAATAMRDAIRGHIREEAS